MKRPSRSLVNGTATMLFVMVLLLLGVMFSRQCGDSPGEAAPVETPNSVMVRVIDNDTTSGRNPVKRTKKKVKKPQRQTPPERSPLDEHLN